MKQEFKINGISIKTPTTFKKERYNLTKLGRIANGDMCGDLVAKKVKFYFTYAAITSTELDTILNAIWETNEVFYTLTYIENNVEKTETVYSGSIPTELHRTGERWVWKNVQFNLIQK